ncbi:hypothetical protein [Cellulomonas fimi]|uniref:hypothetical protein n=1 Tax=Cellulomonas fimi TaxID=1708 RepID=UPI002358351B|nr:hypothetical protein [Cellulomonas fimi]
MLWLEVVGWLGSVLVVVSLMQARVLRFRVLNLVGAVLATGYNAVVGIWAFAVMNGAIAIIDVYWLWRLLRERHDDRAYTVVDVGAGDAYLRHFLAVHAEEIGRFQPGFALAGDASGFLVARGDEVVGVVVVRDVGHGVGVVDLDWVTTRFRDFTPGEFVYRRSGVFAEHGWRVLHVEPAPAMREYFAKVGFRETATRWVREVEAA